MRGDAARAAAFDAPVVLLRDLKSALGSYSSFDPAPQFPFICLPSCLHLHRWSQGQPPHIATRRVRAEQPAVVERARNLPSSMYVPLSSPSLAFTDVLLDSIDELAEQRPL